MIEQGGMLIMMVPPSTGGIAQGIGQHVGLLEAQFSAPAYQPRLRSGWSGCQGSYAFVYHCASLSFDVVLGYT